MRKKDLPLVFFTLLIQWSVGLFFAFTLFSRGIAGEIENAIIDQFVNISAITTIILLLSGVTIATSHLSKPQKAPLAFKNSGSSWLSREALLGLVFGMNALFFGAAGFLNLSPSIQDPSAVIGTIIGLVLVYCIARLYMLRTVPLWNTPATPISFFATALLLGSLFAGLVLAITYFSAEPSDKNLLRINGVLEQIAILSIALVGVQVFALRLSIFYSKKNPGFPSVAKRRRTLTARVTLSVVGAALFWISTVGLVGNIEESKAAIAAMTLGVLLAVTGEILGRILFFSQYKRVGL